MTSVRLADRTFHAAQAGLALVAGLGAITAAGYAAQRPQSQFFGPTVASGRRDRRSIALTFDDGPSPGTLDLLEYLERQGVRATFFQCGMNVERHPDVVRAVHAAGHEIGNHTFSHSRLCPRLGWQLNLRSRQDIYEEFAETQRSLQALGVHPVLLRAPYGLRWFGMRAVQRHFGLLSVMWTVIGHDWEWPPEAVADLVLATSTPGGIVCLHDGRDTRSNPDIGTTLAAVKRIVPALRQQGYRFETVSEMLQPTGNRPRE